MAGQYYEPGPGPNTWYFDQTPTLWDVTSSNGIGAIYWGGTTIVAGGLGNSTEYYSPLGQPGGGFTYVRGAVRVDNGDYKQYEVRRVIEVTSEVSAFNINQELFRPPTQIITLNDPGVRALAELSNPYPPGASYWPNQDGQPIMFYHLWGKQGRTRLEITFRAASNLSNKNFVLNIANAASSFSDNGSDPANHVSGTYGRGRTDVIINIEPGCYVWGQYDDPNNPTTGGFALFITGAALGDVIVINNNGFIIGQGGNGGDNVRTTVGPTGFKTNGGAGRTALQLNGAGKYIINNQFAALIGGGGGGGGPSSNGPNGACGSGGGGAGGGFGGRIYLQFTTVPQSQGGLFYGQQGSAGNRAVEGGNQFYSGAGGGRIAGTFPFVNGHIIFNTTNSQLAVGGQGGGGGGGWFGGFQYASGGYGASVGAGEFGGSARTPAVNGFQVAAAGGGGGWGAAGGDGLGGFPGGPGGEAINAVGLSERAILYNGFGGYVGGAILGNIDY
jgi:hypothetical protein